MLNIASSDLKVNFENKVSMYYRVLQIGRRILMCLAFVYCHKLPYFALVVYVVLNMIVLGFMFQYLPFKDKS